MITTEYIINAKMYSTVNSESFSLWLLEQLQKRGMTQADLARASGITRGGISNLINQVRSPDAETCLAIARAFNLPPEVVFRAAGLLPPVPADTEYQEEILYLLSQLSPEEQQEILDLLRFKSERRSATLKPPSRKEKPPARTVLKKE